MKEKNSILPIKIIEKVCNELFNAGLNVYQIADRLSLKTSEVRKYLKTKESYPTVERDDKLIDQILYDADIPVTREVIIETEKSRYEKYAIVEQKSLDIMIKLLNYYGNEDVGVSLKEDQFKASLAMNFIKATQQCREELLKKYEIDKKVEDNSIKLEFI